MKTLILDALCTPYKDTFQQSAHWTYLGAIKHSCVEIWG